MGTMGVQHLKILLKPVSPHISTHHRFFEVSDLIRSYPDSFESWYNGKHRKIGRLKPPLGYDLMRLEGLVSNLRSVRPQTSQDLLILWEYIYICILYIYKYIYIYTTPRNSFGKQIAGGKILLKLRRKLEKTAEFCQNAQEFKHCRIYGVLRWNYGRLCRPET